jgi:hypothetical protein
MIDKEQIFKENEMTLDDVFLKSGTIKLGCYLEEIYIHERVKSINSFEGNVSIL